MRLTDCYPEIAGDVARIGEQASGACLFVANHASFLDIPVLCCVLDPVFKFIAKDSLTKLPGVGQQLVGVSSLFWRRLLVGRERSFSCAIFPKGTISILCRGKGRNFAISNIDTSLFFRRAIFHRWGEERQRARVFFKVSRLLSVKRSTKRPSCWACHRKAARFKD